MGENRAHNALVRPSSNLRRFDWGGAGGILPRESLGVGVPHNGLDPEPPPKKPSINAAG